MKPLDPYRELKEKKKKGDFFYNVMIKPKKQHTFKINTHKFSLCCAFKAAKWINGLQQEFLSLTLR